MRTIFEIFEKWVQGLAVFAVDFLTKCDGHLVSGGDAENSGKADMLGDLWREGGDGR